MDFSLLEIINLLVKRLKFIIICVFLSIMVFYVFSRYLVSPIYTASVQLYVDQKEISDSADLNQLYYAQKVVTTYISFLQTKQFYKKIILESDLNYTQDQLKSMINIKDINSTEIFEISVTSKSADDSYTLAETMQKTAPELIKSIKSSAQISVVDPAEYPRKPSGPNILLNTFVGGLLGLLLSVIVTFLWNIINVKIKDPSELKKRYDTPILGTIPNYNISNKKFVTVLNKIPFINKYWRISKFRESITDESKFIITEAFNSLKTNLRFTLRSDSCRKIIVNSPLPSEGKSTICTNLAISLAQSGAKVLLLDCDLRKGILHNLLSLKSTPGISDILSGMINDKDAIQYTKLDNLQIIPMGALPPNPNELLGSVQMEELIKRLEKFYDYILFDSAPVNVVSDALSLVKISDGILLVVREGVTSHPNISAAINKYKFSEANILGFVINAASINSGNKKKSQYHYYRKYSHKND